jgi:hypothetical protein
LTQDGQKVQSRKKKASDRNCSVVRIGKQPIAAICVAAQILAATDLTCGRRDGNRVTGFARLAHPQSLSLFLGRASYYVIAL